MLACIHSVWKTGPMKVSKKIAMSTFGLTVRKK